MALLFRPTPLRPGPRPRHRRAYPSLGLLDPRAPTCRLGVDTLQRPKAATCDASDKFLFATLSMTGGRRGCCTTSGKPTLSKAF